MADVNALSPLVLHNETTLAARVQTLTALLQLGRIIEAEDQVETVGAYVPDIIAQGLGDSGVSGVRVTLGSQVFQSSSFTSSGHVRRKQIYNRRAVSGEIEIHSTDRGEPTAEEEMLLAAMTERLARFFERKSLQSALERSEQRYRMVFDSTPVAMISCDARGIVFDVNAYLLSKFFQDEIGKQELVGRHVLELGLCDLTGRETDFMQFARGLCVNLREAPILESRYRGAGYANIRCLPLMDAHGKVEGGLVIIEDITEVREAQRAMIQSAKMAAVGQMMTGFAHEAGTPLGTISANAQYLLKGWEGKAGADELHAILSETNRIANLIEKLLIFARPARFHLLPTSLNDMIQEVLSMMQNQEIMRGIEVITDFRPDIPPLPVEPTLAKQVFFNLIINAAQAMPIGGRLTIASRLSRSRPGSRQPGPYVEVALTDTGVGISPSNLRKIFTPFFTTKEFGKGVGLGLSLSYRIVQNHGGTIVAESRGEGRGATFRVYLPLAGPSRDMSETSGDWIEPVARKRGDHNGSR